MVLGIQLVGLFFGAFMAYYSFLNFKRRDFTPKEFGVWIVLWCSFILVSLFPGILDPIVAKLSISRTMDLFIILGFMVLLFLFFYLYIVMRKLQGKMETIVREFAKQK